MQNSNRLPTIRVLILARAATGLAKTIRSAKQLCDTPLVLSAHAEDEPRIREIAEKHQVQMVESTWCDSVAAARNDALQQAGSDWLLWMEDGETLSAKCVDSLRNRLPGLNAGCVYYLATQVSDAQTSTIEQRAEPRLLPNCPGLRYSGRVAESISRSVDALALQVDGIPERIHLGIEDPDRKAQVAKQGLYLCEREIQQHGPSARVLNHFGECWEMLKQPTDATACFRQAAQLAETGSTEQLRAYHGLVGLAEGNLERQVDLCLKAIKVFPVDMPILCVLAMALQLLGQYELSTQSYETAFKYGRIHPELWHTEQLRDHSARCYAFMLSLGNRHCEAVEVLEQAHDEGLQTAALIRQLLELYVTQGQTDKATHLVGSLPVDRAELAPLRAAICGGCLVAERHWAQARAHLETAYKAGCRDAICFRNLAICYLALEEVQNAQDLILHWLSVDQESEEAKTFMSAAQDWSTQAVERRQLRFNENQTDGRSSRTDPARETRSVPIRDRQNQGRGGRTDVGMT